VAQPLPFSEGVAHELVRISSSMICGDSRHGSTEGLAEWRAPPIGNGGARAPQRPGGSASELVHPVENVTVGTFGAVINVVRDGPSTVLVSYRPTAVSQNCQTNADEYLMPYPPNTELRVHRGYYNAYLSVRAETLGAIAKIAHGGNEISRFVLTGFSLGGAMLTYLAMELRDAGYDAPITFYGFGMPRTGDRAFKAAFAELGIQAVNVWHRGDQVPECALFVPDSEDGCTQYERGFRHAVEWTAWYPGDLARTRSGQEYTVCPSDEQSAECSPASAALNDEDHMFYMGEIMWCCDPAPENEPFLSPVEGGPPMSDSFAAHCHAPFGALGCNPEHLNEPAERGARALEAAAQAAAAHSLQPGLSA